jgi:hypothetical protein
MRKYFLVLIGCIGSLYAQQTKFFRTYGVGLFDVGETVIPINDTNYVVAGTSNTTGMNGTDLLLFKTNSIGDVTWWKSIGGPGIQSGKGVVMATDSSGFYVTGYKNNFDSTGYDIWLVKTNLNGDTLWTRSYGGADWEMAHSINKLSDSTYIIAGETFSFGNGLRDMYLIHIKANGDTLWTKTFGGTENEVAKHIYVDPANNLLAVGSTESYGAGHSDVYVVYMDINGDTIWTKTIGTTEDDFGYSGDICTDTSNHSLSFVIGYTSYYAPDLAQNSYILKIDSATGNSIALYPQFEANPEILDHIKIRQGDPGKHYFTADIKYGWDEIAVIFSSATSYALTPGILNTYASGGNESTMPNDIYRTLDRGYIMTGYSEYWGPGQTSCFLLKTDSTLAGPNVPTVSLEDLDETSVDLFPNPVMGDHFYLNSGSNIEWVKIYTLTGQLIRTYTTPEKTKSLTLEKPVTPTGVYLAEIKTSTGRVCRKVIF